MKKIDWKLVVIGVLVGLSVWLSVNPKIQEVETIKEIEVLQKIIDTFYVDKIVEKKIFVPKYIYKTKVKLDTIIKEVIVDRPVEKIKTIYKDRERIQYVDVPRPEVNKWYAGLNYPNLNYLYEGFSNYQIVCI